MTPELLGDIDCNLIEGLRNHRQSQVWIAIEATAHAFEYWPFSLLFD